MMLQQSLKCDGRMHAPTASLLLYVTVTKNNHPWAAEGDSLYTVHPDKQGRHAYVGRRNRHPSCQMNVCSSLNRLFSICWCQTNCQNYLRFVQTGKWGKLTGEGGVLVRELTFEALCIKIPVTKSLMKWKHSVSSCCLCRAGWKDPDSCTSAIPESSPLSLPLPQLWYQDSHQTHQKGLLGLISAFDALCIKLALLQTAVHDVHGTGHTSLKVLEGRCWKALLQLVAQNLPMGQAEHTLQILQENNSAVHCVKGQHFGWAVAWKSRIS